MSRIILAPDGITQLTGDVTTASGGGSQAATIAKIQGTTVSGTTGTTNVVFSNSPTLVTPTLGVASATELDVTTIKLDATNKDTILTRSAAATLQFGDVNSATPVAQTIQAQGSRGGTDTNISGANLTINSGDGTGNSVASSLIFQTPTLQASGTAQQVMTTRMTVATAGVSFTGPIKSLNNVAVTSTGVPGIVGTANTAGFVADIASTTLFTTNALTNLYRISAHLVEYVAASVSSTLPTVQVVYTDSITSGTITMDVTPIAAGVGQGQTGALTANTVGLSVAGVVVINAAGGTAVKYQTTGYASTAAGMTFAIHIRAEML
jgi:hypothetical protein